MEPAAEGRRSKRVKQAQIELNLSRLVCLVEGAQSLQSPFDLRQRGEHGELVAQALLTTRHHLVTREQAKAPTDNWEKETGDVYIALGNLLSNVRKELGKGKVDHEGLVRIIHDVDAVGLQLAELKSLAEDFLREHYDASAQRIK